ncbi:MAG: helix-turn-helix transcriptional regulator [Lachnoclostridium sp.]|jgi:transcriptional regulator with XRE-family HTH domain|nr:helix-turn-helix transcriptional regulator [Lachnoclostridium sp.]
MQLTLGEKIKIILGRRGMTLVELAEKTGQSQSNMSNKMKRDNFSEKELHEIASVLDCTFDAGFIMNESGERI